MYQFKYGVQCSLEPQASDQPVIIRGSIEQISETAAKAGYDAMELFIRNAREYDASYLKKVAGANGLEFCGITTGMEYTLNHLCLISDDQKIRERTIDALKAHLDLGAQLGCPVIVGQTRGNIPDFSDYKKYEDRYVEALRELSAYAVQAGTTIVVEAVLRYILNYLNSSMETADFLRKLNLPGVKLHIDTHHMNVEDKDPKESVYKTADILGYVHFSDSNRLYPGAGNFDFKSVLKALMDVDYQGTICMECLPYPSEYECAARALRYTKDLVDVLEIENMPVDPIAD